MAEGAADARGRRLVTLLAHFGGSTLPPRPTLTKGLRAIERAFADIESVLAALTKRVRRAEREIGS